MAIEFLCPRCQTKFHVADDDAGTRLRCPQCQAKVRVPVPELLALAPLPVSGASVEFLCPRCHTAMRAPAESIGSTRRCPQCQAKVRVPDPVSLPAHDVEPLADLAADSHAGISWSGPRQRQRHNFLGLFVPVACVGLIVAIGAWLLQKPPVKLEGTLTAERLTDIELGPFRMNHESLGKTKLETQTVFERLEEDPIRASSKTLTLEFKGSAGGINLLLRAADGAEFYRVDPGTNKLLSQHLADHQEEFQAAVQSELARSVPEFLAAVEKRGVEKQGLARLAEFRDSVGLASLVRGFGFSVQASIGKQVFPCVLEDRDGRLYFALPAQTEEFEIVGRVREKAVAKAATRFYGRYSVQVSKQSVTIHREAASPKEKIRKLLEK